MGIPEESPQNNIGNLQMKSINQKPSFSEKIDNFFSKQASHLSVS